LPRQFDFPAGWVGGFGVHGSTGGATGAGTAVLFLRFFEIFRSDFRKYLYGVFGLLMLRNGQKRDKKSKKKDDRKKVFFSTFFGKKVFDMDFPKKVFVVFLNSPC
jgi:hypothetical protein